MNITTLTQTLERHPALVTLVAMEAGYSLPIPERRGDRTYVRLFAYRRRGGAPDAPIAIHRPTARITVDAETGRLVEYVDLRWESGTTGAPAIGTYPHAALAHLDLDAIDAMRAEVLTLTERLLFLYGRDDLGEADRAVSRRYRHLFRLLAEPVLRPYYTALNPEFFAWLDQDMEIEGSGAR